MAYGKRLLSMKEACQYLGLSRMTLIEAEERGLITPERTPGGHRRYTVEGLRAFLKTTQRRYDALPLPPQPQGAFQLTQFIADVQSRARAPDNTLKEALRNLVLLLQLEMGAVYLIDDAGTLRLQATYGIPHWYFAAMTIMGGDSVAGEVLRGRQPRVYDSRARHDLPVQLEFGQGLCAPLIYQDEVLGCVHIIARHQHQFFPSEITIVTTIAVYLASLVVNTQLLDLVQTQLRELALLSQTSAAAQLAMEQEAGNAHAGLLDGLATGVAAVNDAGMVTFWNQSLARLSGISSERVVGAAPHAAAPELAQVWAAIERTLADSEPRSVSVLLPGALSARFDVRRCPGACGATGVLIEVVEVARDH